MSIFEAGYRSLSFSNSAIISLAFKGLAPEDRSVSAESDGLGSRLIDSTLGELENIPEGLFENAS